MGTVAERHEISPGKHRQQRSSPFTLTAHRHALVDELLSNHPQLLHELRYGLGSPLHVVLPQVFRENVVRLQNVFLDLGVEGSILYAKKANKANCFVKESANLGIGIDVASEAELSKALGSGVRGQNIGVTGPEKCDTLLTLAIRHQCLISIDALGELRRLVSLAKRLHTPARILLRVCPDCQRSSRFGLTSHECESAMLHCRTESTHVRLEGFSFHLGGYSLLERAQSANTLIDMCFRAQGMGLSFCRKVDMGGGLPVQYVDPDKWSEFLSQDSPQHYHANKLLGGFYPYGAAIHGPKALRELLDQPIESGITLADKARKQGIGFIVEPGRALLDQAGFSIFGVQGVKNRYNTDGYAIVTVQGSSLSLSEQWFNSEYLPDPVLLDADESRFCPTFIACVGGSTCLECDMVTWRKVRFPRAISPGDTLVYLNTAGYQMDSNESPFHEARLPFKVVVEHQANDHLPRWHLDDTNH